MKNGCMALSLKSKRIDKVSGKGMFASNPYVFVYEFILID